MRYRPLLSFKPLLATASAIGILAFRAIPAHADCVLSEKNLALARVVTKEAKLYYVSGPRKGAAGCPSPVNACRLKAYLVLGDEVLMNATDDPYVCARFKTQSFNETIGLLQSSASDRAAGAGIYSKMGWHVAPRLRGRDSH
jgi:hypothetical protein